MDYKQKTVTLVNPWTKCQCDDYTWQDVCAWCSIHVAESDRAAWLRAAADYFAKDDGFALGRMIIGS